MCCFSFGKQTVNTPHHQLHVNTDEVARYNTIERSNTMSNLGKNKMHFGKYVRHDSDPNSFLKRYAFKQSQDIAHSHR